MVNMMKNSRGADAKQWKYGEVVEAHGVSLRAISIITWGKATVLVLKHTYDEYYAAPLLYNTLQFTAMGVSPKPFFNKSNIELIKSDKSSWVWHPLEEDFTGNQ